MAFVHDFVLLCVRSNLSNVFTVQPKTYLTFEIDDDDRICRILQTVVC